MNYMEFKSVNKILQESFVRNWDRAALTNYQGMTLAYRDVARRIAKLHIAFEQCGLRKGDKVAICSRNQANWGVSFLAAITYGAVAVPILHEFKPGNIHYLVNHSEARVLFVDEVIWEGLSQDEMPGLAGRRPDQHLQVPVCRYRRARLCPGAPERGIRPPLSG